MSAGLRGILNALFLFDWLTRAVFPSSTFIGRISKWRRRASDLAADQLNLSSLSPRHTHLQFGFKPQRVLHQNFILIKHLRSRFLCLESCIHVC